MSKGLSLPRPAAALGIIVLTLIATGGTVLAADITPPTATAPVQTIAMGTVVKGTDFSTVPIRLRWSATDASGIKSYELWRSTNSGPFVRQTLPTPTATSRRYQLATDNSYRFFVRAYNNAGNVSSAKYGPTFTPTVVDDRVCCDYWALESRLPWTPELLSSAYGGTITTLSTSSYIYRISRNTGHAVHYFTGRDAAYVAAVGSHWSPAWVRFDGLNSALVNLHRSTSAGAQVVASGHWPTLGSHMIEISNAFDSGGPINVDAIVVLQ